MALKDSRILSISEILPAPVRLFGLLMLIFLGCAALGSPEPAASQDPEVTEHIPTITSLSQRQTDSTPTYLPLVLQTASAEQTITYQPDSENFPNPERGFYRQRTPLWIDEEVEPLELEELQGFLAEGISLVRVYFVIDEFRVAPLSPAALSAIEQSFVTARLAGLKLIPRFAYNFPTNNNYPTVQDAPLERVLAHIEQLRPILQANADVIAFMEMGFVGAWGEWHASSNRLVEPDGAPNDSSRAIIAAVLDALPGQGPKARMAVLRYPFLKQQLFGPNPLTTIQAFDGSSQARIGAHNDCFLASDDDWGTYQPSETPEEIETYKIYLSQDNRFVPQGGETCNADRQARPYIPCANALGELARMHWQTINLDYHPQVLNLWRDQGCLTTIATHLGYRLRLTQAVLPVALAPGADFILNLALVNDGYAAPYNPRPMRLILRHTDSGAEHLMDLASDPRRWEPGFVHSLVERLHLPENLPGGSYHLFLHLPDAEPALASRPEYSVRFANQGLWEADTGYNALNATILVRP